MWPDRKARFTIFIALLIAANLALWVLYQTSGDHDFLEYLALFDVAAILMFALIGILAAWCLAFRPEALARRIERGIAKRSADKIQTEPALATKPNAYDPGRHLVTIAVWVVIVLAAIALFLMSKSL